MSSTGSSTQKQGHPLRSTDAGTDAGTDSSRSTDSIPSLPSPPPQSSPHPPGDLSMAPPTTVSRTTDSGQDGRSPEMWNESSGGTEHYAPPRTRLWGCLFVRRSSSYIVAHNLVCFLSPTSSSPFFESFVCSFLNLTLRS
jgi:hypothetical protein